MQRPVEHIDDALHGFLVYRDLGECFCPLSRLCMGAKLGGDREVIAGLAALDALAIFQDIACLQAIGHLGTGEDEIDASRWRCCRAGKAQGLGMDAPVAIYIIGIPQELDAVAWRIQAGCGVEERRDQLATGDNA